MRIISGLIITIVALIVTFYAWLYSAAYSFEFSNTGQAQVSFSSCNHLSIPKCPSGKISIQPKTLELLEEVKFCGSGDTTPDAWITIHTDKDISFGLVRMQKMGIQVSDVGLAFPCYGTQKKFDQFLDELFGDS